MPLVPSLNVSDGSGYDPEDYEQHRLGEPVKSDATDPRSAFMHDCDRILYSRAFAGLAGKTQVVAVAESGGFHTRLTHSLKVEQVGRRIAELVSLPLSVPGPSPDLVAAACLAHDIGHPPYGHAGESALRKVFDELQKPSAGEGATPAEPSGGFEGNAQNLRILSYLESRKTRNHRGLHLTRAALDAAIKYPWQRSSASNEDGAVDRSKKFGIYPEDSDAGQWALDGKPQGSDDRPVEEQIMDWADDVTYACHDVEDFYRAGLIPLDKLLLMPVDPQWQRLPLENQASPELLEFLKYVARKWKEKDNRILDRDQALEQFRRLANIYTGIDCALDLHVDRARLTQATSGAIGFFLGALRLERVGDDAQASMTRYRAKLVIPAEARFLCDLMKELVWCYVIDNPALASQQRGQSLLMGNLLRWHHEDPQRLLPRSRLEELEDHGSTLRAVCDHIASLTEQQAFQLHQRMSGFSLGAITDRLY